MMMPPGARFPGLFDSIDFLRDKCVKEKYLKADEPQIDLPPSSGAKVKLEWESSQARDDLPKGQRRSWIRKFL